MIGEDDGSVALGNASHCHMENAMGSLNVMLLQPQRREEKRAPFKTDQTKHGACKRKQIAHKT